MSHLLSRVQLLGAVAVAGELFGDLAWSRPRYRNPNVCMPLSIPPVWSTTD